MCASAAPRITPWSSAEKPTESGLTKQLRAEGLSPYVWSNGPYDAYPPHAHSYDKVIYVVRGTIEFMIDESNQPLRLSAGDRLDLPAGVTHSALVGSDGVICLEAHR